MTDCGLYKEREGQMDGVCMLLQVMGHVRKTVCLDIYGSTIEGFLWQSFVVEVSMDYGRIEQRTRKTFTSFY
jgi:hypothetical protein